MNVSFYPISRVVTIFSCLLALAGMQIARSQGETVPPARPNIPGKIFRITEFGAKAEPTRNNAAAIQQAIDTAVARGGGCVVIPAGKFMSGPIQLQSRIELHLEAGSTLLMSPNFDDFPVQNQRRQNFISAKDASDLRISGPGTIDGQGAAWWKAFRLEKNSGSAGARRPQLIYLEHCQRIELVGFSTLNPPNTHCSLPGSKDLTIEQVTLTAPGDSPNTDAINLSSVQNVVISHCHISTGDDNIVLLGSGNNDPAAPGVKNVLIHDCQLGVGHGLSIGSFTSAGVQNVRAENLTFDGTTSGLRMKAWRDRGGLVKNITYRNITMQNVRYPIFLSSYYPRLPKGPADDLPANGQNKVPEWRDISMEDVTISHARYAAIIWGLPDRLIENLTLKNVKASADLGAVVFHAQATFENVEIVPANGPALQTDDARVKGMEGTPFQGDFRP